MKVFPPPVAERREPKMMNMEMKVADIPVTLPKMPGHPNYTRPGQFAAQLGVEHDPLYVYGSREKRTCSQCGHLNPAPARYGD